MQQTVTVSGAVCMHVWVCLHLWRNSEVFHLVGGVTLWSPSSIMRWDNLFRFREQEGWRPVARILQTRPDDGERVQIKCLDLHLSVMGYFLSLFHQNFLNVKLLFLSPYFLSWEPSLTLMLLDVGNVLLQRPADMSYCCWVAFTFTWLSHFGGRMWSRHTYRSSWKRKRGGNIHG